MKLVECGDVLVSVNS